MQAKKIAFERFLRVTSLLIGKIAPDLRRLELLVFLKISELCQDRWGQVPVHLGRVARSLKRDPSQVRRSVRSLADLGILTLEPADQEGTYTILCAHTPEQWETIRGRLAQRSERPSASASTSDAPALALTPPPASSGRLPPRPRKRKGKGGGDDDGGGSLFQDQGAPRVPPPPEPPPTLPSKTDPALPPIVAPPPAPLPPLPRLPREPYHYPPGLDALVFDDVFFAWGETFSPAEAGEKVRGEASPLLMNSLDRENSKKDRSSLRDSLPPAREREATAPSDEENDDEEEDFCSDREEDDETPLPVGASSLTDVELLWQAFSSQLPGLTRGAAVPLLDQILGWCRTYEEARDYLRAELPAVSADPRVRYPLRYLTHEARFQQWRQKRQEGPRARVLSFQRPQGRPEGVGAILGAVLGPQGAPPAAPAAARPLLPPPSEVAAPPSYLARPEHQAAQAQQGARNALGARAALAALGQLPPERLAADAISGEAPTAIHRGYVYKRQGDGWLRVGPVRNR